MKTQKNSEYEKQMKKSIRSKFKIFGLVVAGYSCIVYLIRNQPQIARKLFFDKLFNSNESNIADSESNFVLFY
jgi:hypothetical protein